MSARGRPAGTGHAFPGSASILSRVLGLIGGLTLGALFILALSVAWALLVDVPRARGAAEEFSDGLRLGAYGDDTFCTEIEGGSLGTANALAKITARYGKLKGVEDFVLNSFFVSSRGTTVTFLGNALFDRDALGFALSVVVDGEKTCIVGWQVVIPGEPSPASPHTADGHARAGPEAAIPAGLQARADWQSSFHASPAAGAAAIQAGD